MTDQTEREALADLLVRTDGERDSISAAVDRILAAGFHRTHAPHVVTTVDGLRDLDPEKVPAFVTARGNVMETRTIRWHSDEILADQVLPATPLVPMQDTPEPPADGYVSRNVYDYDEPEPPADVREALAEAIIGRYPSFDPLSANGIADAILAAGFHRTPAPHLVTTAEELAAIDPDEVLIASGRCISGSTFTRCHVRRLPEFITGEPTPLFEVLIYGDAGGTNLAVVEGIRLPATVLTPAPALPDVIHLTDFRNPSTTAMCGEPTTVITERGDTRPVCQTCHRGAMKSAQAGTPIDREALDEVALNAIMSERYFAGHPAENTMALELSGVIARETLAALPSLGYVRIDPTDEALVEKVAKAVKPLFDQAGLVDLDAEDYGWDAARAVLDAIEGVSR